ncbi:MAG: MBL fold metallo-hydrolase [Kangiellaceae bacterium]|jgi:glyoxylase-like metal-dependent hydrolase (beta-lactamase superfamily II)|nr:MBL fold metallo-hydrolase [Kangiellaceae bacterium]
MVCYLKNTLLASSVLGMSLLAAHDNHQKKETYFSSTELAPGIFMLMGEGEFTGGNLGLSVGPDGVVLIDDSMPPFLDIMNVAIEKVAKKPVDFLINTHVHGDHTGNNLSFGKQGTHIVAHENLRKHLLNKGIPKGKEMVSAPKEMLPVITFSQSMTFHLNGDDAQLIHVANAHTDGDAIIHFKQSNVIHTGDTFFNGMFPYMDLSSGGSVDGYIKAQETALALSDDQTKIIPGHGALATKSDLAASLKMLKETRAIIAKLKAEGKTEQEVLLLNPLRAYHDKWNWRFITTERMTKQLYQGL